MTRKISENSFVISEENILNSVSTIFLSNFDATGSVLLDIANNLTCNGNAVSYGGFLSKGKKFSTVDSHYMQIVNDSLLNLPSGQIDMFIKLDEINTTSTALWKNQEYGLEIISGTIKASIYDGVSYQTCIATGSIEKNRYKKITTQWLNGNYLKIFINGILDTSIPITGSINTTSNNVFIGAKDNSGTDSLNGKVSGLRILSGNESENKIFNDTYRKSVKSTSIESNLYNYFSDNYAWDLVYDNNPTNGALRAGAGTSITDSVGGKIASFYKNNANGLSNYPSWVTDNSFVPDADFQNGIKFDSPSSALRLSGLNMDNACTWLFLVRFDSLAGNASFLEKWSSNVQDDNAYEFLYYVPQNIFFNDIQSVNISPPPNTLFNEIDSSHSQPVMTGGELNNVIGIAFSFELGNDIIWVKNQTSYSKQDTTFNGITAINHSINDLFIGAGNLSDNTHTPAVFQTGNDLKGSLFGIAMINQKLTADQIKAEFARMGLV